jgi:hypothetical protein
MIFQVVFNEKLVMASYSILDRVAFNKQPIMLQNACPRHTTNFILSIEF